MPRKPKEKRLSILEKQQWTQASTDESTTREWDFTFQTDRVKGKLNAENTPFHQ